MAIIEKEYCKKIENSDEVFNQLKHFQPIFVTSEMKRTIYKNGGKYFLRVTSQKSDEEKIKHFFSLKEDSMRNGLDGQGLNSREEIDLEVSKVQLNKLEEMIKLLGFVQENYFEKVRHLFKIDNLEVSLDRYKDFDNLEIEGDSEKEIKEFLSKMVIVEKEG